VLDDDGPRPWLSILTECLSTLPPLQPVNPQTAPQPQPAARPQQQQAPLTPAQRTPVPQPDASSAAADRSKREAASAAECIRRTPSPDVNRLFMAQLKHASTPTAFLEALECATDGGRGFPRVLHTPNTPRPHDARQRDGSNSIDHGDALLRGVSVDTSDAAGDTLQRPTSDRMPHNPDMGQLDGLSVMSALVWLLRRRKELGLGPRARHVPPRRLAAAAVQLVGAGRDRLAAGAGQDLGGGAGLASFLYAAVQSGCGGPVLGVAVASATEALLPSLSARDLYRLAWALASCRASVSQVWLDAFVGSTAAAAGRGARMHYVAVWVYSLARLGATPPFTWVQQVLEATTHRLDDWDGHALCNMVWALGRWR